ncbi:hypothetical protein C0989_000472 [Termitomyces sp. Mn162]|nr:hypothetical protein C0989_000472 [Termitomyces sp. Mn162]
MGMADQQQPATISSQVGISVPAALTDDVMEVDNNSPESIMALMHLLAPLQQLYLPLPIWMLDMPSMLSSALSKGKGRATATLLPTLAQESSTPPLTTWKTDEQHFSAKEKGRSKAKEPEPLTAIDKQIAHLLQWLHEARVPEDVGANILENPVVQLALAQVLSELDVVQNQRDEAHADLFHSALGKGKQIATPSNPPEAKKAHTEPSVFVKGSSTQRAPLVPYNNRVPASDDQRMDECPDFKVASSSVGPYKPVAAKIKLPKPSAGKEGMSKPSTKKASTRQATAMMIEADNSTVVATPIAFPANVPQGAEAGIIKVLKLRTYAMPSVLPQEYRPPVH